MSAFEARPPYRSYAAILGLYAAGLAGAGALSRALDRDPQCQTALDLGVLGLATFKVARTLSRDSVASHDKFKTKYKLPFPLVSDEDGKVCEAYGTWVEKSMYGRKYMGIDRATFLIDEKGVIRGVWRKVKVPGHAEEVLKAAAALK